MSLSFYIQTHESDEKTEGAGKIDLGSSKVNDAKVALQGFHFYLESALVHDMKLPHLYAKVNKPDVEEKDGKYYLDYKYEASILESKSPFYKINNKLRVLAIADIDD